MNRTADPLTVAVGDLLVQARQSATSADAAACLDEARSRLHGPLRVAIAGKVKAGKSTLLNALLGEELAATDAGECTKIITWYLHGGAPEVVLRPRGSAPEKRFFRRDAGAIDVDLGTWSASEVEAIEVHWPTQQLRDITLIDTPGISSIRAEVSERTHRVLAADSERPPVADAVLYLLRHTHASDVRFLESFHDDDLAHGTAMNAVGVLSRADEIGSCRLGALEVAAGIAERYRHEPRLRRLCPVIVPVAGLLGYAGATLREQEYRALAVLAGEPAEELSELLLTADRFASRPSTVAVTELEREHLLCRLGLFGVRLAVELARSGTVTSSSELSRELLRRCGMDALREVLLRQFLDRSRVLKARSALSTLDALLRTSGCGDPDTLRLRVEEVASGAHEFEEVRTLNALRNDEIGLNEDRTAELDRLLGGSGHGAASRLDLAGDADPETIREAAGASLSRWQRVAEHPLSNRKAQIAARVAVRTLEGLLSPDAAAR